MAYNPSSVPEQDISGDAYSKIVSDVSQSGRVASEIFQLGRVLIEPWAQKRASLQELKASLGSWESEAFDANGRCQIPRLTKDAFEQHMEEKDVCVTPEGNCLATSGWPHLLHALNIRPCTVLSNGPNRPMTLSQGAPSPNSKLEDKAKHRSVVTWRPVVGNPSGPGARNVKLDVDGSVICHLSNLFLEGGCAPVQTSQTDLTRIQLQLNLEFGKLVWETTEAMSEACFYPEPPRYLYANIHPFGTIGELLESGTLWVAYQNALRHGISNTKYMWPDSTVSLAERVGALRRYVQQGWLRIYGEGSEPEHILLTERWLKQIGRIQRRVLTDGGQDHSFFEDLKRQLSPTDTEAWTRSFLLDDTDFRFDYPVSSSTRSFKDF